MCFNVSKSLIIILADETSVMHFKMRSVLIYKINI